MADPKQNGGRQDARIDDLERRAGNMEKSIERLRESGEDQRNDMTGLKTRLSGIVVVAIVLTTFASNLISQWIFPP